MKDPKLKSINLIPYHSPFANANGKYSFHVKHQRQSLTIDDIAAKVASNNAKYSANEIAMLVNEVMETISEAVIDGYTVNTPLFSVQLLVNGSADREQLTEPLHHDQVNVYAGFKQGVLLRQTIPLMHLRIYQQPQTYQPIIGSIDCMRIAVDKVAHSPILMPGAMTFIRGRSLKLVGDNPSVGITFTNLSNASDVHHITPNAVFPNQPTLLQFTLPANMTEGEWEVTVTTQYGCGKAVIREPRSSVYEYPVLVRRADAPDNSGADTPPE